MEQTLDFVFGMLEQIFLLFWNAVAFFDKMARIPLIRLHFDKPVQNVIIMVFSALIVITSFRAFGAIIGAIVTVILMLLITHILVDAGYLNPQLFQQAPKA